VVDNAARQGDAHGDHVAGLRLLNAGLARFVDAPAVDRARALLYRAELAVRLNDSRLATESLQAALALDLTDTENRSLVDEFAHAAEVLASLQRTAGHHG
jgi:hypothetical protein